jgi:hypothetical protein
VSAIDRTKAWTAEIRESFRDAIEEVSYEREQALVEREDGASGECIAEKEALQLLSHLHGSTGGDLSVRADAATLSRDLGITVDEAQIFLRKLAEEGHVEHDEAGNTVSLTSQGAARADEHWRDIGARLDTAQQELDKQELPAEQRAAVQEHLDAIRAQLQPGRRDTRVVKKRGERLRRLLPELAKGVVVERIARLLPFLFFV